MRRAASGSPSAPAACRARRPIAADVADGFIVLVDARGARIVADGLGYTNEAPLSPDGALAVRQRDVRPSAVALPRRRRRLRSAAARRSPPSAHGTYPDGLAFDAEGRVWITSIVSNRVLRVAPDGAQTLILEDADPAHVAWCEEAYLDGTLGRDRTSTAPPAAG